MRTFTCSGGFVLVGKLRAEADNYGRIKKESRIVDVGNAYDWQQAFFAF
jgi:hypothetical protein